MNTKTTKYYLRAGLIEQAENCIGLFTRAKVDPKRDIQYMQVVWYETELADAHFKNKQYTLVIEVLI